MAEYTDNLALIVRYDGTKDAFDAVKSNYLGKVVFITGSSATGATTAEKKQAIWVSNGVGGKYLDMSNIETLKAELEHITKIYVGTESFDGTGGIAYKFVGADGIGVVLSQANGQAVITFSGADLKTAIVGTSSNNSITSTYPNTITGAKAYADSLKTSVLGDSLKDNVGSPTIAGAKLYAAKVKSDLEGKSTDTKDSPTIEGAKKYADDVAASKASTAKSEAIQASKDYVDPLLANKADLVNGKINESQLPDYIFGQMLFGGTITAGGDNTMEVSPSAKLLDKVDKPSTTSSLTINKTDASTYEGAYFIVTGNLTSVFGFATATGDWIVSTGVDWRKVDNTDAVASVAGLTGTITASDLAQKLAATGDANELALKSEVDKKYTKPDNGIPKDDLAQEVKNSLDDAVTDVSAQPSDTDYLTFNVAKSGTVRTITYDVKTDNTIGDAIVDTTKKGLATVEDVAAYIKARLSVKVVS